MYNRINITGLAGEDSWALVAGIEGQDTNDIIMNNLIEVHSTGDVDENTNIYGMSYSQSAPGDHSFDIINNTVLSDGFYSVYLESATNSTITHNTLISYLDDIENGHKGYKKVMEFMKEKCLTIIWFSMNLIIMPKGQMTLTAVMFSTILQ